MTIVRELVLFIYFGFLLIRFQEFRTPRPGKKEPKQREYVYVLVSVHDLKVVVFTGNIKTRANLFFMRDGKRSLSQFKSPRSASQFILVCANALWA